MISKLEINGVHMSVGDDLRAYVSKKIGLLDKYMSKHARQSAHVEVKLKESKIKTRQEHVCEVIVHLPHDVLALTETAANIFAAVDIVEQKLKISLRKYKELHNSPKLRQHLAARLARQAA